MSEPDTPAEYEKAQQKMLVRYKELYRRYQKVKKQQCDCDRMGCGRCAELNNLARSMTNYMIGHHIS